MKKKILTKHILMTLAMAAMVPAGQAWAWEVIEDGKTLASSDEDKTLNLIAESPVENTLLDQFTTIQINHTANQPQRDFAAVIDGTYSGDIDLSETNFKIIVSEEGENADGLHIMGAAGEGAAVTIGDFSGHIQAANSDGISIVNEAQGSNTLIVGSIGQNDIDGDGIADGLKVDNGNGIRASAVVAGKGASKEPAPLSAIQVNGNTDITINGETITAAEKFTREDIPSLPEGITQIDISGGYSPAAVYAGDDMNYITSDSISSDLIQQMGVPDTLKGIAQEMFKKKFGSVTAGNSSIGQGKIILNGTTTLKILESENKQGGYGLYAGKNGTIKVNGALNIISEADNSYGIAARNANLIYGDTFETTVSATNDYISDIKSDLTGLSLVAGYFNEQIDTDCITFGDDYFQASLTNLDASPNHGTSVTLGEGKDVSISMQGDNSYAMYAEGVDDTGTQVSISGEKLHTLYAEGDMLVENGGLIKLGTTGEKADDNGNSWGACQLGAVIASGTNKVSDIQSTYSLSSAKANYILSDSVIAHAGDLDKTAEEGGLGENAPKINSALYAEHGGQIDLGGSFNYIAADYSGEGSENYSRRAVWAYDTADINITGGVQIAADDSAQDDPTGKNSTNMAIVAGTATSVTSENVNDEISDHATVTVNYDSESAIKGDIVSAYAGQVDIKKRDDAAKINITGNLLAGNGGILTVDLGNGGVLEGRADDYGDAGSGESSGHGTTFFNPAFSSDIYKGGAVNLTMGEGSRWNVTGQSWITQIDTTEAGSAEDSGRAVIDLVSANTDRNKTAHALTISEMKGDAVFHMSLDEERTRSDMLYMKNAKGDYIINVVDPVTTDDMYAGDFHGLRFATVGEGSDVSFRAVTIGQGLMNVKYTVKTDPYEDNDKNKDYNGTSGNTQKPGDAMVDGFFDQTGGSGGAGSEAGSSAGQYIMLMAQNTRENSDTEKQENEQPDSVNETTNYKLTGIDTARVSNAGQTVLALSRVNYSNAVYMDRLNKRMGEARYIDGDDGLWVRLRHDRIGKEDAFRSMNTMFELGYDWKVQDQKNGEHRRGVAFDYMRGEADYTNVMGSGDVRRAGVWLYDTWLGDKGHYSDYVVKYGRLSNDFDIFNELGTKVSGDYDNDVWSASAEYGRKKDIGSEWYFEPQAQLQYAYVTSADYTTSQNTKVELDGIDSLIGRAGFRLGRDTSEGNTVYFKADILHEFLGDQSIHALDKTGELSTTYENEGTWYDVGFGFSHRMGEDSYMFLDVEHSFGNDNEDTYQINIGLNRAF